METQATTGLSAEEITICREFATYIRSRLPDWSINWDAEGRCCCLWESRVIDIDLNHLYRGWKLYARWLNGPWLDYLRWAFAHEAGHAIRVDAIRRFLGPEWLPIIMHRYNVQRHLIERLFKSRNQQQLAYLVLIREERIAERIAARLTGTVPRYKTNAGLQALAARLREAWWWRQYKLFHWRRKRTKRHKSAARRPKPGSGPH